MYKLAWKSLYLLSSINSRKNKLFSSSKACTRADTFLITLVNISMWLRAWICNGKGTANQSRTHCQNMNSHSHAINSIDIVDHGLNTVKLCKLVSFLIKMLSLCLDFLLFIFAPNNFFLKKALHYNIPNTYSSQVICEFIVADRLQSKLT